MAKGTLLTAQQAANLIGVSVETLRKHAAAGKVKGQKVNGFWVFNESDLPQGKGKATKAAPVKRSVTDVVFVLDGSGSMNGLHSDVRRSLEQQIAALANAANESNTYEFSVINFGGLTVEQTPFRDVRDGFSPSLYRPPGGGTPLHDAIGRAINTCAARDDNARSFLISVLTDGEENQSTTYKHVLIDMLKRYTKTDRYTFTFAGPHGCQSEALGLGIPSGNITSWEQTAAGLKFLSSVSTQSLSTYTSNRSAGIRGSTSFYVQPNTTDAANFAQQLQKVVPALAPTDFRVERVGKSDPLVVSKFAEKRLGGFQKGKLYYELTSSEKVQSYKQLIVHDTKTGQFYAGQRDALSLLGVPNFSGTVRLKPGNLGEFKVFVQSTSTNRKLVPDTAVVVLK
jgi:uncharacterized protein YegL